MTRKLGAAARCERLARRGWYVASGRLLGCRRDTAQGRYRSVPRVVWQVLRAGVWHMWLVALGAEKYRDAGCPQFGYAALECRVGGLRGVEEGQGDQRQPEPDSFGKKPQCQGVGDSQSPLVDGIEAGATDNHRGRRWQHVLGAWLLVVAAYRVAGLPFQGGAVNEAQREGGGNDADCPAAFLRHADESADVPGGRRGTGDDVQHVADPLLGHAGTLRARASVTIAPVGRLPRG